MALTAATSCARFAAGLAWRDVPPDVARKLIAHLLDTVAVMGLGAATSEAAILLSCQRAQSAGAGRCTIVTKDGLLPPADAALLNAFAGRRHTFDDTLEAGPIHPGSALWAASLAAGEHVDAPLTRVLLGALCGYELAVRLADAVGPGHYNAGFHGTGTCNAPAAALAAAIAMGLDAPRAAHAISLAAGFAAGTRQYQIDGAVIHSAMNGAHAAACGVRSALYAAAGFDAPAGQLDGRWGFVGMFAASDGKPDAFADLGTVWSMRRVGLKPYPTCRFTHGPIAMLETLRHQHGFGADAVARIGIRTFAQSASVSDRPTWKDREEAILSHQFALAATLIDGPPAFAALDRLSDDAALRVLASRIDVQCDPALEDRHADEWPHLLQVTLRDGREFSAESRVPPGSLPDDDRSPAIRAKAEQLIEQYLGSSRLAALEAVLAAPEHRSVRDLTASLGPREQGHAV